MQAQTIPNVTGSITSSEDVSQYSHAESITIQLQSSNFSLSAVIDSDNLLKYSGGPETVTINPSAATSDVTPLVVTPGFNSGTLTYNGATYNNLQISLNIAGDPAIVANGFVNSGIEFQYEGGVNSVPFLLTGTVTAYNSPPSSQGAVGTPLFSLNFSGGGLYNASVVGGYGGGVIGGFGNATYQLLANPIGFHTDLTTQGNWSGQYGGEGYLIANGPSQLPGYATVSVTQASTYTWARATSDPRALQSGFNATSRFAATYSGNNYNINIRPTDNNPHTVALYLLDFDNSGRSQTLTVTNGDTGAVLDTETFSNLQNGLYAVWNLQGNIRIDAQGIDGAGAAVSGIFFGPPATILNPPVAAPSATAMFTGTNTVYEGAWVGHFGSSGYLIANGPGSPLASGTLSVTGAFPYTWAAQTADPRALDLNSQGTSGIASAYTQYASTSFQINVNNPNAISALSLYLLDWENAGRVETITVTDMGTGIVLDTETASSFQRGVYYSWKIGGNVVVTITPSGNAPSVVSGIFLN